MSRADSKSIVLTARRPLRSSLSEQLSFSSIKVRKRVREHTFELTFPLYVVPIADVLNLEAMLPHNVLKARGLVREYVPGRDNVIFISHRALLGLLEHTHTGKQLHDCTRAPPRSL